jgi:hypothetical protein
MSQLVQIFIPDYPLGESETVHKPLLHTVSLTKTVVFAQDKGN